jgi:hypothetical protein
MAVALARGAVLITADFPAAAVMDKLPGWALRVMFMLNFKRCMK